MGVRPTGPKLYGREEPRIFTPPLRELTPDTSLGFAAIEFAEDVLGIGLYPWQKWLLIHALELLDDGSFRFRHVVVLVARQNGKSRLSQVLALFCMYVLGIGLVLGTAQDLDTAEEVWQGAVDLVEELDDDEEPARPELLDLLSRVVQKNGAKALELKTGERYKVKAASRRGGRGLSGDLILLDELREHQTWEAWGAITKTTMARPNAQIWALSNAGDASSVVLRYLRKMAHQSLGDPDGINANDDPSKLLDDEAGEDAEVDPDDDSLGIFEWSAPPGCGVRDRDGWAQANPSLGHGISEKTLASDARTDPEWTFRTECMCQWSDGTLEGPFPAGAWDDGIEKESALPEGARVGVGLSVAWNRSRASISVAGLRDDDLPHVEVIASRAGTDWVVDWFTDPDEPQRKAYRVAIQPSSPAGSLIEDLEEAGIEVVEWKGLDLPQSHGRFYDAVKEKRLKHRPQAILDVPASVAVPKTLGGDAWVWDLRRSPVDISGLVSATAALWLLTSVEEEADPFFAFA